MKTRKLLTLIALLIFPAFLFAANKLNTEKLNIKLVEQFNELDKINKSKMVLRIDQNKSDRFAHEKGLNSHSENNHEKTRGNKEKHKKGKKSKKHFGHTKGKGHKKHSHHKGHNHGDADEVKDETKGNDTTTPMGRPDVDTPDTEIPAPKDKPDTQPKGRPGAE